MSIGRSMRRDFEDKRLGSNVSLFRYSNPKAFTRKATTSFFNPDIGLRPSPGGGCKNGAKSGVTRDFSFAVGRNSNICLCESGTMRTWNLPLTTILRLQRRRWLRPPIVFARVRS